ncbi:MAG: hypothetical protein JSU82_11135 [Rhodospirillales bacterium]|nr:MAG: hypothetical protein JSU82_11135 [Rhodospirillales bacterium]
MLYDRIVHEYLPAALYVVGALVYQGWYMFANWQGFQDGVFLMWYASIRSLIWPLWLLMGAMA